MALAVNTDVEAALGRSLTAEESARAVGLLDKATAEVERWTGFRFTAGDYTITRTVRRGQVRIPAATPTVAEVRAVDCVGNATVLTDWTLRRRTLYVRAAGDVEVDFTTPGISPDEVVNIVATMVARSVTQAPDQSALVSQAGLGSAQVSYTSSTSGGSTWLTKADKALLSAYRGVRSSILLVRD